MSLEDRKKQKQQKKRNRLIFRSVILGILAVAVVFALIQNLRDDNTVYQVGDDAPDFELEQISQNNDAETIKLSDFKGKGVMLNFWGTFCEPCKTEMPYMESLYPEYKDKGVEIIAVSLDGTKLVVDDFIDEYDITFPIPHDKNSKVRDLYNIGPIPTTYFIDPDGKIVEEVKGALTLEKLEGSLKDIEPN